MTVGPRIAIGAAVLVALQLGAWWIYTRVESQRAERSAVAFELDLVSGSAPALDVAVARSDGTAIELGDLAGRGVVVHFWASWCVPCREELPTLLALEPVLGDEVVLVLVSVDEDWAPVRAFFSGDVPRSVVLDATGALRQAYGATALPQTWVIDATGQLRAHVSGARDWRSTTVSERLRSLAGA